MNALLEVEKELMKLDYPNLTPEETDAKVEREARRAELYRKRRELTEPFENPFLAGFKLPELPEIDPTKPTVFDEIIDLLGEIRDLLKAQSAST